MQQGVQQGGAGGAGAQDASSYLSYQLVEQEMCEDHELLLPTLLLWHQYWKQQQVWGHIESCVLLEMKACLCSHCWQPMKGLQLMCWHCLVESSDAAHDQRCGLSPLSWCSVC